MGGHGNQKILDLSAKQDGYFNKYLLEKGFGSSITKSQSSAWKMDNPRNYGIFKMIADVDLLKRLSLSSIAHLFKKREKEEDDCRFFPDFFIV